MPEISDDTKELISEDLKEEPSLEAIRKKISNNRNEDKSVQLWVCLIRITKGLDTNEGAYTDNSSDGGSWSKAYGCLFDDKNEVDRATKAKTYFLIGWLEIIIFFRNWIENTIIDKDYFQYMETIHQEKNDFLSKDQFIFSEQLDFSIASMEKYQNYLIYKEKIPKDINSLQSLSENQKKIFKLMIIKNEKITDLEAHINKNIDDSFTPKQKKILKKVIEKGITINSIKKYIEEIKLKVVKDTEINLLEQISTFIGANKKLISSKKQLFFTKKPKPEGLGPQTLNDKRFSKKPWKVFASKKLHSYYYNRSVGDVKEKKFPKFQESLKTINFQTVRGSKRPSIVNMISWIDYLTGIDNRDIKMKNSLFDQLEEQHSKAEEDKIIISQNIKKILFKIEENGYKGLTEEEKQIIDQGVKESPKIKWEFKVAKLNFTEKKIVEDYHKRKALREAAEKKESLLESFIKTLQNFSEQMTFPRAAVSLVTAGIAVVIISYSIYSSGPAKFNVNLKIVATTKIRAGSPVPKEFTIKDGGELDSENQIRIIANIDKAAFIYIISHDSSGKISLINKEVITAVKTLVLPGTDKWYPSNSKSGEETIYLIASKNKIEDIEVRLEKLRKSGIDNINQIFKKEKIEPFRFRYK